MITIITMKSPNTVMLIFLVNLKITLLCGRIVALITRIADVFMYSFFVYFLPEKRLNCTDHKRIGSQNVYFSCGHSNQKWKDIGTYSH